MRIRWWATVSMAVGVSWVAGVFSLAFSAGEALRAYQLGFGLPIAALIAMDLRPSWARRPVAFAAGTLYLLSCAAATALVLSGRVALTDGAWPRRLGAALGAIACLYELARLLRARGPEVAPPRGPVLDALVVLMRPGLDAGRWLARLGPGAQQLGEREARVGDITVVAAVRPFATVLERPTNWLAWPQGESQQGLTYVLRVSSTGAEAARAVCALAVRLLESSGAGVIVPSTGRAVAAGDWLKRVGEGGASPLGGFVDMGPLSDQPGVLVADGFALWGLPDLSVDVNNLPKDAQWDRGTLVLAWAADQMIKRGAPIEASLEVPVGAEIGNRDVDAHNPDLEAAPREQWDVVGPPQLLRCSAPWAPSSSRLVAPGGYLPYRMQLKRSLFGDNVHAHSGWLPLRGPVPAELLVFAFDGGFLSTSVGLGRWPQPGSGGFIELSLRTSWHSLALAERLARLTSYYFARGPDAPPWGDWHRVSIEGLELAAPQFRWVVLHPWREHELGDHRVTHWSPVLMTAAERDAVPTASLNTWLTPGRVIELSRRWLTGLPQVA